jgi:cell division protease FtsH
MAKDNGSGRTPQDRNSSPGLGMMLWAGLIVGAGLLAMLWIPNLFVRRIPPADLYALIEASKPSEDGLGTGRRYVDVRVREGGRERIFRYSEPSRIVVRDRSITGVVDVVELVRQGGQLVPDGKTAMKGVAFRTAIEPSGEYREQFVRLLADSGVGFEFDTGPTSWDQHGPWIVFGVLSILLLYFMLRRLVGAGSPMSFGRSRGRLYAQEDLGVTFSDVAGIDEAVEEVREIVDFLRSPEKYQRLGGRIPKGLLLVGPPGTGKTLLAKAIAGEAGVPFFSLSGSDFVEMFVGVGAARVRDMFQQAEAKAPCIIFIDELDALGKSRGTSIVGGHDEREQTLNALLVEMDGFGSNSGVIVMAATNRPETLDPALLRPGRFDRHVLVDRPDIRGREAILKVHVKNVKLDPSVDLKEIAAITPGFVGADLANLVNEAALLAARAEKQAVGMKEFNEGVERVTAGLEKKQRIMNEEEKLRVAYHESGHALVACSLPNTDPVHKVSIIPRGLAALGYTMQRPEGDRFLMTQSELESRIQVLLAGTIAEEIVFADISTGAQNDLERATEIARKMVMEFGMSRLGRVNYRESGRSPFLPAGEELIRPCSEQTLREIDQEVRRIIDEAIEKVRHILETRRAALEALTRRLMEVESVDAEELKRILDENSPGPLVVPGTDVPLRLAPAEGAPALDHAAPAAAEKKR